MVNLKYIENKIGRKFYSHKIKAREIDIDILFYSTKIINKKGLIIPHPRLEIRNFVLVPLNDIASSFNHPILNKSIKQLLEVSTDNDLPKKTLLNLS